jgi:hypothetical protein
MKHEHSHHGHKMNHHAQKYTCPMHPGVISDKPGNCPKCGMTLVPVKEKHRHEKMDHSMHGMNASMDHEGHDHHAMMIEDFKKAFLCCAHPYRSNYAVVSNDTTVVEYSY